MGKIVDTQQVIFAPPFHTEINDRWDRGKTEDTYVIHKLQAKNYFNTCSIQKLPIYD